MDLPCCKSFKLAALSLKRDLLATQHLIKSFANNAMQWREYALFYDDLRYSFSNFFLNFFLWKHLAHSVYRVSAKKLPVWAFFSQVGYMANTWLHPNNLFFRNFDYLMSKLTTFNQSAVLCLCWSLSALPFFWVQILSCWEPLSLPAR